MVVTGQPELVLRDEQELRNLRAVLRARFADIVDQSVIDDAGLIASELVTNAILHGKPPVELRVAPTTDGLRIEVADGSSMPPVRPLPSRGAMTGRGLRLVEALAQAWGCHPAEPGKVVWAELTGEAGGQAPAADAGWEPATIQVSDAGAPGSPTVTVELGEVPTDLLIAAKEHVDNLVREFTLAASGAAAGTTASVPPHLARLMETVVHRFALPRRLIKEQAIAARRLRRSHVRLVLTVPVESADAGSEYLEALDEADSWCRAARLLTLETPPQHRIFRRWYVEELIAQLRAAAAGAPSPKGQTFEQRLLEEIGRVAAAVKATEHAARLSALTGALAVASTAEAVSQAVLVEGVAALSASGGGVLLADYADKLWVPGTVGYAPEVVARLREESRDAELPAAAALRTGAPVWLESRQERETRFPQLAGLEPGTVALCAVPLEVARGQLGALRFSFNEPRLFDHEERTFVLAIAAQTAQALDRVLLLEERIESARRLQRSLLPPRLPEVPGARVEAAYQPAGRAIEIGGDFYDVWACGDGCWALAIGDVAGTGPEAAAVTAMVRYSLRALTLAHNPPAEVLANLNRTMREQAPEEDTERFCTALFGYLRPRGDALVLDLATGGHPGPLVVRADGQVEEMALHGSLLGVLDDITLDSREIVLEPGAELIAYTDGITETRGPEGWFGTDGILRAVKDPGRPASTATAIMQAVLGHVDGDVHDDLALLVVRCEPQESAPATAGARASAQNP